MNRSGIIKPSFKTSLKKKGRERNIRNCVYLDQDIWRNYSDFYDPYQSAHMDSCKILRGKLATLSDKLEDSAAKRLILWRPTPL